jgi:hypothetical protein
MVHSLSKATRGFFVVQAGSGRSSAFPPNGLLASQGLVT